MNSEAANQLCQNDLNAEGSILLQQYMREVEPTDKLPKDKLQPVLMGLFGEVGSVVTTAKKHMREDKAYVGYQEAVEEEFGDVLWYFTALCRRLGVGIDGVFASAIASDNFDKNLAACDLRDGPVSEVYSHKSLPPLDQAVTNLGKAISSLLEIKELNPPVQELLVCFAHSYLQALQLSKVSFAKIACKNIEKTRGRFLDWDPQKLPTFDKEFPKREQLPSQFEISISQQSDGKSYLRWKGVNIGDPLTDNSRDPDGYRFHDVFHLANAAILHWSPVFRALIKQKRKSDPKIDEVEDGGRAIVVEEGLTAWIFSYAKGLDFFEGHNSLSFDLLKNVQQFVRGYEVQACPLKLWERAIMKGYEVFRLIRENNGGIVVGDRDRRDIEYQSIQQERT